MWGEVVVFDFNFPRRSFLNLIVKKNIWNFVHFCRSYRENKNGPVSGHGVMYCEVCWGEPTPAAGRHETRHSCVEITCLYIAASRRLYCHKLPQTHRASAFHGRPFKHLLPRMSCRILDRTFLSRVGCGNRCRILDRV